MKNILLSFSLFTSLTMFSQVTAVIPPPQIKCDINNPGDMIEVFNLRDSEAAIIEGQTNVVVTYHETSGDALGNGGVISNPETYTNMSAEQVIFVRVENVSNANDWQVTTMDIKVRQPPVPDNPNPDPLLEDPADGDGDGIAIFDLTDIESQLAFDPFAQDYTYHLTQVDAENGENAITDPTIFQNTANPQDLYVLMKNAPETECETVVSFQVIADGTLGIDENNFHVSVYPNPTTAIIVIERRSAFAKLQLYSLSGQIVFSEDFPETQRHQIDLSTLSSGMYFLQLDQNTTLQISKH